MKSFLCALLAIAGLFSAAENQASAAPILFGVDSACDCVAKWNVNTGTSTVTGTFAPTGRYAATISMAVRPSDQAVFIWNNGNQITNSGTGELVRINPANGDVLFTGQTTGLNMEIAFTSSGVLFGVTSGVLYTVDVNTGGPTITRVLSVAGGGSFSPYGADIDSFGILYAAGFLNGSNTISLATIDTGTGAVNTIGSVDAPGMLGDIVFAPDGTLYGTSFVTNTSTTYFFQIDKGTGAVSNLINGPSYSMQGFQGLGFVDTAVPEPQSMMLFVAGFVPVLLRFPGRRS